MEEHLQLETSMRIQKEIIMLVTTRLMHCQGKLRAMTGMCHICNKAGHYKGVGRYLHSHARGRQWSTERDTELGEEKVW